MSDLYLWLLLVYCVGGCIWCVNAIRSFNKLAEYARSEGYDNVHAWLTDPRPWDTPYLTAISKREDQP